MKLERKLTPLSAFVIGRLNSMEMSQSQFCRDHNFDQGLLSKIMSGQVERIILDTAIKLALGLGTTVENILQLTKQTETLELWLNGKEHA